MNLIKTYIQNFLSRAGSYVFGATVLSRILSFLSSWIALQFIDNKDLGVVLYAWNIISFIIPFGGLGLYQSLIRYGAMLSTQSEKNSLFLYVLKKGVIVSFIISIIIVITTLFIPFKYESTGLYITLLSIVIPAFFIFQIISIQFRLQHNNKLYSFTQVAYNAILVLLMFFCSYFYKETGYILALILTPVLTSSIFLKKININFKEYTPLKVTNFSFWKYGFYSGLTSVVTDFLLIIDILLIGYLLNDSGMVTIYRYVSIIPISLLFLPRVFIATDFVFFTERITDKTYIFNYIKSYMLLFSFISIILLLFFYLTSEYFLAFFDKNFVQYKLSFYVLIIGVSGIFIFRGLFGNLLSSIGRIEVNSYIIFFAIILNIISNLYMIPEYGILGASITSAFLMWFTGIASFIWFFFLYKKILSK